MIQERKNLSLLHSESPGILQIRRTEAYSRSSSYSRIYSRGSSDRPLWKPISFEDKLLESYLKANPGRLFLEVPLWFAVDPGGARRIDGVLIPGEDTLVYPSGSYALDNLQEAVDNQAAHLIEANKSRGLSRSFS